jgi:hypothetical protein
VWLKVADNNVHSFSFELLRFLKHAIRLANSRRIAEK